MVGNVNKFVDKAIRKHGHRLNGLFLNADGKPVSKQAIQMWRIRFPVRRAIEWEEKIGDPRYVTAPHIYPPSEYRKKNGK